MNFGLLGKSLKHSFSKVYFSEYFKQHKLPHTYQNFEINSIELFHELRNKQPNLKGLNVTIPYKEEIIPFIDELSDEASAIGAINTVVFKNNKTYGYNTDVIGFEQSIAPILQKHHNKALILGTGGGAKAVQYVLLKLGVSFKHVSRNPNKEAISYAQASNQLHQYHIVINTTPLGSFPNFNEKAPLDVEKVNEKHLFYDLIYNPEKTKLLQEAESKGALIKNGLEMLHLQAQASWQLWMDEKMYF